ncbi:MAG: HU family DNA-binding protein [Candidatus Phytoplasma stylosanthis]|uniref:HU family DNA-binding protein n=1 Tax=Candidatus Phytoplasma stylosanthis TaxID=2798314 RepID=UPI002939B82D|nr:HU family DNA-binding protein [Candidatus Phytoplasma stylosanthis]MDV3171015.1 HU family DNA-binding protein [Candidatus Phytoplasma stylosanthis]
MSNKINKKNQIKEKEYISKKDLIKKIACLVKTSITNTETFYNAFEKVVIKAITSEQPKVIISSKIGFLKLKPSPARIGLNPNTLERIKIPASTRITFKVASSLKKEVKSLVLEE